MQEEVVIKHKKKKPQQTAEVPQKRKFKLQYQIIAVLLIILAVLTLFSLVSYNTLDQSTAEFSLSDIFGLIGGDEQITGKVAQVNNWLGVAGAMLSYALFNHTIGFGIILFPLFLYLWALALKKGRPINKALPRLTIVYVVAGIMFASMMGSFQQFDWGQSIPGEWSGAIGLFLADKLSLIIKPVGAVVFSVIGLLLTAVIGFDKPHQKIIDKFKEAKKSKEENTEDIELENSDITIEPETDQAEKSSKTAGKAKKQEAKITALDELLDDDAENDAENDADENDDEKKTIQKEIKENYNSANSLDDFVIDIAELQDEEVVSSYEHRLNEKKLDAMPQEEEEQQKQDNAVSIKHKKNTAPKPKLDEDEIDLSQAGDLLGAENNWEFPVTNDAKPSTSKDTTEIAAPMQTERKTFTLEVEEVESDELNDAFEPLGTAIHDEEINYEYPDFEFLDTQRDNTRINESELKHNSQIIRETLETFKILIDKLKVTPGPVVTQYEFVPAPGVKVSRITAYSDDIAMALKAKGIRIIAPIPGKGTVGIEIPNSQRTMIRFHEVVNTVAFANTKAILPMALGKTISGETYITDLAKMPHLLIAGTTGAGKSVGMNTIICSLLYKMHPSELKFVIIDPKRVEMPQYADLGHLFMAQSPDVESDSLIINDSEDAIAILKSTVKEMENRYKILEKVRLKNIADYNTKIQDKTLLDDNSKMVHRKMPYIVVIIDELADLMMSGAKKEIEFSITRLAQMARAVGIHLVLATQRPSTDVITGLIKANFPARIAYKVNSGIDSRTILDQNGAEKLIGYGDMLCMPPGIGAPVRVQNAFIDTDEVERICEFMREQEGYSMPYMLPSANENDGNADYIDDDPGDRDAFFADAARLVVENKLASVSMLQRRLKVGYARAGRIIDQLEMAGIVGKFKGSKSREVMLDSISELEAIL